MTSSSGRGGMFTIEEICNGQKLVETAHKGMIVNCSQHLMVAQSVHGCSP